MSNTELNQYANHWQLPLSSITYEIFGQNLIHPDFNLSAYILRYQTVFTLLISGTSGEERKLIQELYERCVDLIEVMTKNSRPQASQLTPNVFSIFCELVDSNGGYLANILKLISSLSNENLTTLIEVLHSIQEDRFINPKYTKSKPLLDLLLNEVQRRAALSES